MKKRRLPWYILALLALSVIPILFRPAGARTPGAVGAAEQVQDVWRRVRAAGAYDYTAEILQTTTPLPTIANAGRASKTNRLRLEGDVNLPDQQMQLALYGPGVEGVELSVEKGRARARHAGGPWQQVDDFTTLFAPGGDFLAYVAAASHVENTGRHTRTAPALGTVSFTRYTFAVNGPGLARYLQEQLEAQMRERGELPPGISLAPPDQYARMTGRGELWVREDGYPLRQILQLDFPPRADAQQLSAQVTTDFGGFAPAGTETAVTTAPETIVAAVKAQAGDAAGASLVLLFAGMIVFLPRSRKSYTLLALLLISTMLLSPLLQGQHVAAFYQRQQSDERSAETEASGDTPDATTAFDPHADPLSPSAGPSRPQAALSPLLASAAVAVADPQADSDGDGLRDGIEAELGTNPTAWDSDGDLITDTLEIAGFQYGGESWYGDPLSADSNGDTLSDGIEWGTGTDHPDSDGDGTPDLFDQDNDGDGVPDQHDLSPHTASAHSFAAGESLELVVDGLAPGRSAYVEFQLRPENADHLWYAFNVLDWPADSQGLMQDEDGKTFFDLNPDLPRSPNDNGDLKLVPMLEIVVESDAGNPSANLPWDAATDDFDSAALENYGVALAELPDDQIAAYVPLQPVSDDNAGTVAFTGKMLYRPLVDAWGSAHRVRLVWVVQALVDNVPTGEGDATADNSLQVLHTYDDAWRLTGLTVREDHGAAFAVIHEDPATDANLNDDSALLTLGYALGQTFLAGRAGEDGALDLTMAEIQRRFDVTSTATLTERWGITQTLDVSTYAFSHFDQAVMTMAMTETTAILNRFDSYWSATAPISPTLLLAGQQRYRAANLDLAGSENNLAWNGDELTLVLPSGGADAIQPQTTVTLKASPYFYEEAAGWQPYPLDSYWLELGRRYGEGEGSVAAGFTLLFQLYYAVLAHGLGGVVEIGEVNVSTGNTLLQIPPDEDLARRYGESAAGTAKAILKNALQSDFVDRLGGTRLLAFLGDSVAPDGSFKPLFSGPDLELLREARLEAAKSASSSKLEPIQSWVFAGLAGTLLTLDILAATGVVNPNSAGFQVARTGTTVLLAVNATYDTYQVLVGTSRLIQGANNALKATTKLGAAARSARAARTVLGSSSEALGASTKAAVAGLVLEVVLIWGIFVWSIVDAGVAVFSIAFNFLLASAIAATIIAVLFFILALTIVGAIIVALISLFDLIASLFCRTDDQGEQRGFCFTISGWLTGQLTRALYGLDTMVELIEGESGIEDFSLTLADPAQGYAAGNTLVAQATFGTAIRHKNPAPWQATPFYLWQYTENNLRSTAFNYVLAQGAAPTGITPDRDSIRNNWADVSTDHTYWGKQMLRADSDLSTNRLAGIPLAAGINYNPQIYLGVGFALPAIECWTIPLWFPPFAAPVCYGRNLDGASEGQPLEMAFDVFPATLDEFYALSPAGNGSYRLAWDADFPVQRDADGDGLISRYYGGLDPDDSHPDTDGDALADRTELEIRAAGISIEHADPVTGVDTDGDGLCDADEVRLGTNPTMVDSDGDALTDGQEVRHQDCGSGTWTGGWLYITEDGTGSTWVTPDPLRPDSDLDGLSDRAEFSLGAPYHPLVWNPNPVGLYTEIGGGDLVNVDNALFVQPGGSFGYTATVRNNFDHDLFTRGLFGADLPEGLSSGASPNLSGGLNGPVYALAMAPDGTLYAGGQFSNAGGAAAANVARWNDGGWEPLGSGTDGPVYALTLDDQGKVYVGGDFGQAGGSAAANIARWDGQNWFPLGAGMTLDGSINSARINALAVALDGDLYATGQFLTAGASSVANIARWDGIAWSALGNPGSGITYSDGYPSDGVEGHDLAFGPDGSLYVVGQFEAVGDERDAPLPHQRVAAEGIARYAGGTWHDLDGFSPFESFAVAVAPDGDVYVSSWFDLFRWDGQSAQPIASYGTGAEVQAIAIDKLGNVYAGGGYFSPAGDTIARWNGLSWTTLNGGTNDWVRALALAPGGNLYVGGDFTQAGSRPTNGIAHWNELVREWPTVGLPTADLLLAQGETSKTTHTVDVASNALSGPALLNSSQRSNFNTTGNTAWEWAERDGSSRDADAGLHPWYSDVAPAPGWDSPYAMATLLGPAGSRGDSRVSGGRIAVYPAGKTPGATPVYVDDGLHAKAAEPPAVACADNGNCLVVWAETDGDFDLYGAIISADLTVGDPFGIATGSLNQRNERAPAAASDGIDFVVAWREDYVSGSLTDFQIWANRVSNAGVPDPITSSNQDLKRLDDKITTNIRKDDYVDVAWAGDHYAVVWENFTGSSSAPALLESGADSPDSRRLLEMRESVEPGIDGADSVASIDADVWLAEVSPAGNYVGDSILAVDNDTSAYTHLPQVAYNPSIGQTLVAYRLASDESMQARLVDGSTVGAARTLGERGADRSTAEPRVAYDAVHEGWLAAWGVIAWEDGTDEVAGINIQSLTGDGWRRGAPEQYLWQPDLAQAGIGLACPAAPAERALWLRFDEALGATSFEDGSGHGRHATCAGAQCPATALLGKDAGSARFDGADDYVEATAFDIDDDFTLSLWANIEAPPAAGSGQLLLGKHNSTGGNQVLLYLGGPSGGYQVRIHGAYHVEGTITTGWQHLVAVGQKSGASTLVTVYRDGQQLWQQSLPAVVGDVGGGKPWVLGQDWDGSTLTDFFAGRLDDVTIFDRALSPAEVARLYENGSLTEPDTGCLLAANAAPWDGGGSRRLYLEQTPLQPPSPWMGELASPAPETETVIVDGEGPAATISTTQYSNVTGTLIIGGSAADGDDGSGVALVEVSPGSPGNWQPASGLENWTFALETPLSEGAYPVYARAGDALNNVQTAPAQAEIVFDRTPPTVGAVFADHELLPLAEENGQLTVPLAGTISDPDAGGSPGSGPAQVAVRVMPDSSGWQPAALAGAEWTLAYPLAAGTVDPSGTYTVSVRATDNAGNHTPADLLLQRTIRLDGRPPDVSLAATGPSTTTISSTVTLAGQATEAGPVTSGVTSVEVAFQPADDGSSAAGPAAAVRAPLAAAQTFTVNSSDDADDGLCDGSHCSLREAIGAANVAAGADTIDFDLPAGSTILLGSALPTVTGDLTLVGPGEQALAIDGNNAVRILYASSANLTVTDLTIQNGYDYTVNGVGIGMSNGDLILRRVTMQNNVTPSGTEGGAIYVSDSGAGGSLLVEDSTFVGNEAYNGGAIYTWSGVPATIHRSLFDGNQAVGGGGAIFASGPLTVTHSTMFGNESFYGGGALISGGPLLLDYSTVSDNRAKSSGSHGGGLRNLDRAVISNSTFAGNSAPGDGGAIDNTNGQSVSLTNVTLSGNSASTGGGLANEATVTLINVTMSGNAAGIGANLYAGGTTNLTNTLLAHPPYGTNCYGTLTSTAGSHFDDTSCNGVATANLGLDPVLADNGGPTLTHALLGNSAAIDAGVAAGCPATDQRGRARPEGAACDAGAIEYSAWQLATLDQPGATSTGWSLPVPADLEGVYSIDLRAGDGQGNRHESTAWRGLIDTQAPRVALTATVVISGGQPYTALSGWAEDFSLTENGFQFACALEAGDRVSYDSAWWQEWSGIPNRLYRLTPSCLLPGDSTPSFSLTACDRHGRCTTESTALAAAPATETAALDLSAYRPSAPSAPLAPPSVAISPLVLTSTHALPYAGGVQLQGTFSASAGVAQFRVQAGDDGVDTPAFDALGNTWQYPLYLGDDVDGVIVPVTAVITDTDGASASAGGDVTVDLEPPAPFTTTLSYDDGGPVPLGPGDSVRLAAPTMRIEWTATTDGAGVVRYWAGWSSSQIPDPAVLAEYAPGTTLSHQQTVSEPAFLYGHVGAEDVHGNRRWETTGPIYVDGPLTPALADLDYSGWTGDSCVLVGASYDVASFATAGAALAEVQRLFVTWNDTYLRLAWEGFPWHSGNELHFYLDTTGGGSSSATNYAGGPDDLLPPGMEADYALRVTETGEGWLLENDTLLFQLNPAPVLDESGAAPLTNILLPRSAIGNPTSLKLVALAREANVTGAGAPLWAAMPGHNPVNHPRATNPLAAGQAGGPVALTAAYEWTSLGHGICPAQSHFADSRLQLDVTGGPPGVEVGYLEQDLLNLLSPGAPLDGDLDGIPDTALPLDIDPATLGIGQTVVYTVSYANPGPATAPNVTLALTPTGALDLGGVDTVNLGDVPAGVTMTATIEGTIAPGFDAAELQVSLGDGVRGTYDWFWVLHPVDRRPPTDVQIGGSPFVTPNGNRATGSAADVSGIATVELRVNGGTPVVCVEPTPDDGQWACTWNAGGAANGTMLTLEARAADPFGQWSAWSAPTSVTVDAGAPTLVLDKTPATPVATTLLPLAGSVLDDRQAVAAEICLDGDCETVQVQPGAAISGTWTYDLELEELDGEPRTLSLAGIDGAGNRSQPPLSLDLVVDNVAPVLTATQLVTDIAPGGTIPVLSGTAVDGDSVESIFVRVDTPDGRRFWEPAIGDASGWSYALRSETQGQYRLLVRVVDDAGNSTNSELYRVNVGACTPAPVVSGQRSATGVDLSWPVAGDGYQVWWAVDAPYFTPGLICTLANGCAAVDGGSYNHPIPDGDLSSYTFVVRPATGCGATSVSNRVGVFAFELRPGGE